MWHDVTAFDTFLLQLLVLSTNLHLLVSFVESLKPVGKVSARWSRIAIASFQTRWMKRRSWTLQSSWNFWRVGELKVAATEVANNLVIRRSKNIYTVVIYIYIVFLSWTITFLKWCFRVPDGNLFLGAQRWLRFEFVLQPVQFGPP